MLKYSIYILFLYFITVNPSISEVRKMYKKASKSKEATIELHSKLATLKSTDNYILLAYKAASLTLMAKHAKGFKSKKSYFKEGATLLESIIVKHPNDLELRFIRLTIQENSPKIVRYKKNINDDKLFIYSNLKTNKDLKLKENIKVYVLESKSFSTEEKNVISKL